MNLKNTINLRRLKRNGRNFQRYRQNIFDRDDQKLNQFVVDTEDYQKLYEEFGD